VTLCNPRGHDTGEYVRAIFNNFVFVETAQEQYVTDRNNSGSSRLKNIFEPFLKITSRETLGTEMLNWAG
jgi:hypothetical protein